MIIIIIIAIAIYSFDNDTDVQDDDKYGRKNAHSYKNNNLIWTLKKDSNRKKNKCRLNGIFFCFILIFFFATNKNLSINGQWNRINRIFFFLVFIVHKIVIQIDWLICVCVCSCRYIHNVLYGSIDEIQLNRIESNRIRMQIEKQNNQSNRTNNKIDEREIIATFKKNLNNLSLSLFLCFSCSFCEQSSSFIYKDELMIVKNIYIWKMNIITSSLIFILQKE